MSRTSRTTQPEKPHEKDAEYMRKAYIYTAILLILGLIGGLLLADRIVSAEEHREVESVEQQDDADPQVPSNTEETPSRN